MMGSLAVKVYIRNLLERMQVFDEWFQVLMKG